RLLSLIEFAQQSARLGSNPAVSVAGNGLFALYEHQMQGLPGIRVNIQATDSADEIWLSISRLHETKPPDIAAELLRPWVQVTSSPTEEPRLRQAADGASLIGSAALRLSDQHQPA